MGDVLQFPARRNTRPALGLGEIRSFKDFGPPADPAIEARVQDFMPVAARVVRLFPDAEIAEMLAYAAARLERSGFDMFVPSPKPNEIAS